MINTLLKKLAIPTWFLWCLALGAVGVSASLHHLWSEGHLIYPGCLFYKATGIFCPGCGMTRMVMALSKGDSLRAWQMNPFGVILIASGMVELLDRLGKRPIFWQRGRAILHNAKIWATGVVVFVVMRDIPIEPFSWLAPG